jgi:PKD repeat protein
MRSFRLLAAAATLLLAGVAGGCGHSGGGSSDGSGGISNPNPNPAPNSNPVANFTFSCTGAACTFADASSDPDAGDSIASYDWDFGDGTPHATTPNPSHSFTVSTSATELVTLTVSDSHAAIDAVTKGVPVIVAPTIPPNTNPTANFSFTCAGVTCGFVDASSDPDSGDSITSWDWDFGDGTPHASTQNPSHTFNVSGNTAEKVTLAVTDARAGTGSVMKDVPVTPAALTCGDGTTESVSCPVVLPQKSIVTITLTASSCLAHGNSVAITSPIQQTLFTDGCYEPVGTVYTLNGGNAFDAGTILRAAVTSGVTEPDRNPPAVSIAGSFPSWTIYYDDGGNPGGKGEPDFNDLILTVDVTVVP